MDDLVTKMSNLKLFYNLAYRFLISCRYFRRCSDSFGDLMRFNWLNKNRGIKRIQADLRHSILPHKKMIFIVFCNSMI